MAKVKQQIIDIVMAEVVQGIQTVDTDIGEECPESDKSTDDGYDIKAVEVTKKLIADYYSWKLSPAMADFVELAFKQMKNEPDLGLLNLIYGKGWSTSQLAKKMRRTEKVVSGKVDELIKRAAVAMFGVDAIYLGG